MTIDEYFGRWMKVIDKDELKRVLSGLKKVHPSLLCPSMPDIFRAFELCPYDQCKVVFIGQDPYPQKGVATGILFGNRKEVDEESLSPSLQVIKESVINFEIPHNFITVDNSLESWAKQGILMINSALTCEVNKVNSHVMLWRPFMTKFLKRLSENETGLIYVLFGKRAQTLKPYINQRFNNIIEVEHPAYLARINKKLPYHIWGDINKLLKGKYNEEIIWFNELKFNDNETERTDY